MNPDLLAELRRLFMPSAPADATATPAPPRQMTIGPRTGTRMPLPEPGMLAAIQRSAQPSPDTPGGMLNEMFNPIRAGAQARELAGRAAGAMRRGEAGRAAGLGALAAMAVPGVPGPDDAARMIDVDGVLRPRFNAQGRLIHPSDEGIRNFWRWFDNSSAVDEAGRPRVMYHGTSATDIEEFAPESGISWFAPETETPVAYAMNRAAVSRKGAPNLMPVYLRTSSPIKISGDLNDKVSFGDVNKRTGLALTAFDPDFEVGRNKMWEALRETDFTDRAAESGYDAVMASEGGRQTMGVFDAGQIKSATGNTGAFSRTDPRITAGLLAALGLGGASSRENKP
jgi:hypothetical protein